MKEDMTVGRLRGSGARMITSRNGGSLYNLRSLGQIHDRLKGDEAAPINHQAKSTSSSFTCSSITRCAITTSSAFYTPAGTRSLTGASRSIAVRAAAATAMRTRLSRVPAPRATTALTPVSSGSCNRPDSRWEPHPSFASTARTLHAAAER